MSTRVSTDAGAFNATLARQQTSDTAVEGGGVTRRGNTVSIAGVADSGTRVTRAEARQTVSAFEGYMSPTEMRSAVQSSTLSPASKANVLAEIARRERP